MVGNVCDMSTSRILSTFSRQFDFFLVRRMRNFKDLSVVKMSIVMEQNKGRENINVTTVRRDNQGASEAEIK